MLILVDCGTTNMRLRLYRGAEGKDIAGALAAAQPLDEIKYKTGVRDAVRERSDEILRETLGRAIREMLDRNSLAEADVEAVICSGTLSSHVGIYHIHHVVMPVSPDDTAAHSELVTMPDVSGIPILFIPGVKGVGEKSAKQLLADFGTLEQTPEHGITIGIHTILGAKKILLVGFGARCAKAANATLTGRPETFIPASFLQLHTDVEVYLDADAAAQL